MDDRTLTVIITAAAGFALVLFVRWLLQLGVRRYVRLLEARRAPDEVASMRTRLSVLERLVVIFLALIVVWQVLSVYAVTGKLANAVLASGAVLAAFVGIAFSAPLGNLGAGILLAFSQPVRIGDRVTVDDLTGAAEQITLSHTILVTDDDKRLYVPNSKMMSSVIVNRTIKDPRRWVTVQLPVSLAGSIERAREVVTEAARASERLGPLDLLVRLDDVRDGAAWLTVIAYAQPGADVPALAGELRERAVGALVGAGLLAA